MICTVTFNPTLDHTLYLDELVPGKVNRATHDTLRPGGKGINVSIVLARLGVYNSALGFIAGFTGHAFLEMVEATGAHTDLIRLPTGTTRINVKLETGQETDINTAGPDIPPEALEALLKKLDGLGSGDTLVLAGTVPHSLPENIYEQILARLKSRGIRFVVDATGALLRKVVPHGPFLIKPNLDELGALFGVKLTTAAEAAPYAKQLQAEGARNVLVSMGGKGAVLFCETGEVIERAAPEGNVHSAVGSGDSMVAGFLAGYQRTGSYERAFELGIACGSATAFNEWLGDKESIAALLEDPAVFGL